MAAGTCPSRRSLGQPAPGRRGSSDLKERGDPGGRPLPGPLGDHKRCLIDTERNSIGSAMGKDLAEAAAAKYVQAAQSQRPGDRRHPLDALNAPEAGPG